MVVLDSVHVSVVSPARHIFPGAPVRVTLHMVLRLAAMLDVLNIEATHDQEPYVYFRVGYERLLLNIISEEVRSTCCVKFLDLMIHYETL